MELLTKICHLGAIIWTELFNVFDSHSKKLILS